MSCLVLIILNSSTDNDVVYTDQLFDSNNMDLIDCNVNDKASWQNGMKFLQLRLLLVWVLHLVQSSFKNNIANTWHLSSG